MKIIMIILIHMYLHIYDNMDTLMHINSFPSVFTVALDQSYYQMEHSQQNVTTSNTGISAQTIGLCQKPCNLINASKFDYMTNRLRNQNTRIYMF